MYATYAPTDRSSSRPSVDRLPLNVIPFVDPAVGVVIFAAASLLKNTVNRIGDLLDDGLPNSSFKS